MLAIEALWERLGLKGTFSEIVKRKRLKVPYERALLAMTANRLYEPESELAVWDRCMDKGLSLRVNFRILSLNLSRDLLLIRIFPRRI